MYAASQGQAPHFLRLSKAAPAILEALASGDSNPQSNGALRSALAGFDVGAVPGLNVLLASQSRVMSLQRLTDGRLSPQDLEEARTALTRLVLAGEAVGYHAGGRPGKVGVTATKSLIGLENLKKAYSPGVAYPSRLIHIDRRYEALVTNVMNSVAVVSDGSACLGDGALGPYAFHPIGEGKAGLMLMFAGLDAYSQPREWPGFEQVYLRDKPDPEDVEKYISRAVESVMEMRPAYGAFNLEDISNRTCFEILSRLQGRLDRLIWHDDQQGTAMVTVAGLLTALKIQGKYTREAVKDLKIAIAGAGAAGIVCGRLIRQALRRICPEFSDDQVIMKDSRGLITESRKDLSAEKRQFAIRSDKTFEELLLEGVDVFIGVSPVGTFKMTLDQVRRMRPKPIIFGLANPDPEIFPEEVDGTRDDAVVFTGRSDYPNQGNNANAFPGTLAGGLDVGARLSTDDMALAGAFAMAEIPFEAILPDIQELMPYAFVGSRKYAVASAFDPRVHFRVADAVARAAVAAGVAQFPFNHEDYARWFMENRLVHGFLGLSDPTLLSNPRPLLS
jgi:malate dehydrogenase (oxaloacetate-decarboxylating)(NADP+)